MKKIYSLFIITCCVLIVSDSTAQCSGNRYHDYIFPANPTPTSDIVYGSNVKIDGTTQSLKLDVYQPVGDTSTSRALVIVAHGGSFVFGDKVGPDVVPLCGDFARLGYVAASMEYRLGMTNFPFSDSADAGAAVMRAVHDGRAAIRFFRKNAREGGNTYKIDTNKIFFAGVSAGGFIALHIAYMDHWSEFPAYVDTTGVTSGSTTGQLGLHGGLDGLSGNPEYSSGINAVINICGALGDTSWINTDDIPLLSFHGTNDATVPYGTNYVAPFGTPIIKVNGSHSIALRADHVGVTNCLETWYGQDHVPEIASAYYYDSTITISRTFLEHFTCGIPINCSYTATPWVGVNELTDDADFSVYPNPAGAFVTVNLSGFHGKVVQVELFNMLGEHVRSIAGASNEHITIARENLRSGIYLVNIIAGNKLFSKKIIFE